jgi:hypothetical protein
MDLKAYKIAATLQNRKLQTWDLPWEQDTAVDSRNTSTNHNRLDWRDIVNWVILELKVRLNGACR